MRQTMEHLLELQRLQLELRSPAAATAAKAEALRKKIPEGILARFDRLVARGKKGVALARHGVCTECHLRITAGTLASLAYTTEVHSCDNCGRFLYLPEDEPLGLAVSPPPESRKPRSSKRGRPRKELHVA